MSASGRSVVFADSAAQSLLREGKLDSRWVGSFFALPRAESGDERTWTPAFFALRHFVSMYLPLRYWSWVKFSGNRNQETEGYLATLIVTVEETLWRGLLGAARLGAPTEGADLVRLVFGADNPLRCGVDARRDWEQRYTGAVREISSTWRRREGWPRWEAMALHFASFYLPVGLPQGSVARNESGSTAQLLDDLAPHVHPDVTSLVGLWLDAATAARDDAGVPVVEWSSAAGRRLTGRTETEVLLLG